MYIDVLIKKTLVLVEQVPGITVDYENGLIAPALYMQQRRRAGSARTFPPPLPEHNLQHEDEDARLDVNPGGVHPPGQPRVQRGWEGGVHQQLLRQDPTRPR